MDDWVSCHLQYICTGENNYLETLTFCLFLGPPAPRPVQQLVVHHTDESSVTVLWNPPAGEWDSYTVVLRQVNDAASIVDQKVLSWEARQCTFYGLISGCLYSITVTTNSGNLSSSSFVTTRTSNSIILCIARLHSAQFLLAY